MKRFILFYLLVFSLSISAQMNELDIMPHHINFTNNFEKNKIVTITNYGKTEITIDSLNYDSSMLYLRHNGFSEFPVTLQPDSSIALEVILLNYFSTSNDTSGIIKFYNNSNDPIKTLNVNIEFKMGHRIHGNISGHVSDGLMSIPGAKIVFFFDGIYIIDSVFTDDNGDFNKELPSGNYFVSAQKNGYYMQFNNLKYSPLDADFVEVGKDNNTFLNFILEKELITSLSISGTVYDESNDETLEGTVIVVSTGTHTPTKIQLDVEINPNRSYSIMTDANGKYKLQNIQTEGDYFIKAFSQHYIPGYYNHKDKHESFWGNADSVAIIGEEKNLNIYLERDSSYGGGTANGRVKIQNNNSDSLQNSLILAFSTENNKIYNYNFSRSSGEFNLDDLPSGNYKLITDKIGFTNSESEEFFVTATQDTVSNLEIVLLPTSVKKITNNVTNFNLAQNYPNPFNPSTTIEFSIPSDENIKLIIYNMLGQKVAELLNGFYKKGFYAVRFNASKLPSGIYIYRLETNRNSLSCKMELIK